MIIATNLIFSYFVSDCVNIWFDDVLQVNLSLFWCTVTAQYFMFDSIVNFKYKYSTSVVKVHYFVMPRFRENLKEVLKVLRYPAPAYILFYKDITALTSGVCGSPTEELSFYFLLQPTTILNILITSLATYTLLSVSFQAVIHVASQSALPKIKGQVSIEKCAESLSSEDVRIRHSAITDLLRECSNSFTSRQVTLSLQDGHPVIWHLVYKEWLKTLYLFNKSVGEKPASTPSTESAKTETVKPVGRALIEEKPTQLFSLKEPSSPIIEQTKPAVASKISKVLSDVGNDALVSFRKSAKDYLVGSRLGKYLLTEQAEIVSENKLKDLGFMVHGSALCEILCCVAPSEDKYGVVQLVLPEILNTVSATLKSIDQVPIVGSTVSHSQLKRSLHLFLHHVINTYQSSIFNLTLSSETTTLLQQCCI